MTNKNQKLPNGTLSFIDTASGITINEVINKLDKDSRVAWVSRETIEDIETECYFTQIILTTGMFGNDKNTEIDSVLKMVTQIKPDAIIINEPLLEDGACSQSILETLWSGVNLVTNDNPDDIANLTAHLQNEDDLFDLAPYTGEVYKS